MLVEGLREEIGIERTHQLSENQLNFIRQRANAHKENPQAGKDWKELKPKYYYP